MKRTTNILFFIGVLLLCCNPVWAADEGTYFPDGTYIFDFHGLNCTEVNLIEPSAVYDKVYFDPTHPLNEGTVRSSETHNHYYRSDGSSFIEYLVLTFNCKCDLHQTHAPYSDQFVAVRINSTWYPSGEWTKFGTHTLSPVTGTTDTYLCVVGSGGTFSWSTDASLLPSSTPRLYFGAGANGLVTTHTAGGSNISSGAGVTEGTTVNLVATPADGYAFYGWRKGDGTIISTASNYVFPMPNTNLSLTAVFYLETTDPAINDCAGCFKRTIE